MEIWISQDYESGEYIVWDDAPNYKHSLSGPFEISNETYERIREIEGQFDAMQDVLATLVYDWKCPEIPEIDCG